MADFSDPDQARAKRGGVAPRHRERKWTSGLDSRDDCPTCDGSKRTTSYICAKCEKRGGITQRIPLDEFLESLAADRPQYERLIQGACTHCPMLKICDARLMMDLSAWVLCEIPDQADIMSASEDTLQEYELWLQNLKSDRRVLKRRSSKSSKNGKGSRSSGRRAPALSGPGQPGHSLKRS